MTNSLHCMLWTCICRDGWRGRKEGRKGANFQCKPLFLSVHCRLIPLANLSTNPARRSLPFVLRFPPHPLLSYLVFTHSFHPFLHDWPLPSLHSGCNHHALDHIVCLLVQLLQSLQSLLVCRPEPPPVSLQETPHDVPKGLGVQFRQSGSDLLIVRVPICSPLIHPLFPKLRCGAPTEKGSHPLSDLIRPPRALFHHCLAPFGIQELCAVLNSQQTLELSRRDIF
mmetsp:Transcript_26159/g.51359  ORF Transcript_26159/g.51359 Transcript_26159/m.51359 type:complete len:225 (-) Transcript_26159:2744-3418(-)